MRIVATILLHLLSFSSRPISYRPSQAIIVVFSLTARLALPSISTLGGEKAAAGPTTHPGLPTHPLCPLLSRSSPSHPHCSLAAQRAKT
ncbi:hypothetical protein IWZ03DRAFT_370123 [Phyllosticta citriasiana]|uniref:Secreted protein n=1 Tax=Phyllosticta citriasiana TaxID=595635 RepID=A0ABR1KZN8_9PEZI